MIVRRFAGRAWLVLLVCAMSCVSLPRIGGPHRRTMKLDAYVKPDGAITVYGGGSHVEPYFAMRALNTAADLGADVDRLARGYISWQLARLDADPNFHRYCLQDHAWTACAPADADDAALALWIELLYRTAGRSPLPLAWKRSADASRRALGELRDSSGVYVVSKALRTALFMDNVEVLSSLDAAAKFASTEQISDSIALKRDADRLRSAIPEVFWNSSTETYRVSTQASSAESRFYPETVAQLYPAMFGYGTPVQSPQELVAQWLAQHQADWIAESATGAAWGLTAVAAMRAGRADVATCWLGRATKVRPTARWNVADEAIYRALAARLPARDSEAACRASQP